MSSDVVSPANRFKPIRGGLSQQNAGPARVLSSNQMRLWFLDQLTPGTAAYNITDAARIYGALNVPALRIALDAIVERHEILRTSYRVSEGAPIPVVVSRGAEFKLVDLSTVSAERREPALRALLAKEAARPFDLAQDVMLRVVLFRLAEDDHVFFHNSHHIAWDLRSKFIFYEELSAFYRSACTGEPAGIADLGVQYSDYALWQKERLQGGPLDELLAFWKVQLADAPLQVNLPTDFPRPPVLSYRGGPRVPFIVDGPVLAQLEEIAPARPLPIAKSLFWNGVRPFPVLVAAFATLLQLYSGDNDILLSSPYGNRESADLDRLIGFFPNTMVLRFRVSSNDSLNDLSLQALDVVHAAVAHAALPFDKMVEAARPVRRRGQLPVVQVNFRVQRAPVPQLELHRLTVDLPRWIDSGTSKFDLALEVVTAPELPGYFEYNADLFRPKTIQRMAADFDALLREMLDKPAAPAGALNAARTIRECSSDHPRK